jgi:hypothetical protein
MLRGQEAAALRDNQAAFKAGPAAQTRAGRVPEPCGHHAHAGRALVGGKRDNAAIEPVAPEDGLPIRREAEIVQQTGREPLHLDSEIDAASQIIDPHAARKQLPDIEQAGDLINPEAVGGPQSMLENAEGSCDRVDLVHEPAVRQKGALGRLAVRQRGRRGIREGNNTSIHDQK